MQTRPEIVTFSNGKMSYLKIVQKIKVGPDLKDLDGPADMIRRTLKWDLIIGLKKSSLGKTKSIPNQSKNHLEGMPKCELKIMRFVHSVWIFTKCHL